MVQKDTCTIILTTALFTIAKTWKQPKHRQMNGYRCDTHTHTQTTEYYSAIKKNEIMPFAGARMDLEMSILSQMEKNKYHMISFIFRI